MSYIQRLVWDDVADSVFKLNPELAATINALSPDKTYSLYKVHYRYGDEVLKYSSVKKSFLQLPNDKGELVPINDPSIAPEISDALGYNLESNPVCMALNKSMEIYLPLQDRVIPYRLINPGEILGSWGILGTTPSYHPYSIWEMSAGARSIFMLPPISDNVFHKRLQQTYNLTAKVPKQLINHWHVFKELSNHVSVDEPWSMDILFFSKEWFKNLNDEAWQSFRCYLLEIAWRNSGYLRNHLFWNMIFSIIQTKKELKRQAYINDIAKHILSISLGVVPGFVPAINNNAAPIELLQDIYANGPYKLRNYAPILMIPQLFLGGHPGCRPVYYSPGYASAMEFSLKNNNKPNLLIELKKIYETLQMFISEIRQGDFDLSSTLINEIANTVDFKFFHFDPRDNHGIHSNDSMIDEDESFKKILVDTNNTEFPVTSHFTKACVRVKHGDFEY